LLQKFETDIDNKSTELIQQTERYKNSHNSKEIEINNLLQKNKISIENKNEEIKNKDIQISNILEKHELEIKNKEV
jgi:hypothetical protein